MRLHRSGISLLSALLLTVAGWLTAHAAEEVSVAGTWQMEVQTEQGTGSPKFVLEQNGETISGTYEGQLGQAPVKGTVKGNAVEMTYVVSGGGQELEVKYAGTIEGDTMKGTVSLGQLGEGTFTGKKQG
jgi:hypothetical protein